MQYKIIQKGAFEKIEKFQDRLNQLALEGWRVVTIMSDIYVILGKEKY